SGTGLSAGARPCADGLLISLEKMAAILEIDTDNQVAVVQPGVTLADLDTATAAAGLMYTVFPGELSASVGGNVGTNAGGMRAVKYGVTRHNVLGLQAALPTGELIRTGGRITKLSTGYDLTQLIIGSEGTCALATEITVRLYPRLAHSATLLAPFPDLPAVMRAVPTVVRSGVDPVILEYVDKLTLAAISYAQHLNLGIPDEVRDSAEAHLVIGLENRDRARLDDDVAMLGELLGSLGAVDVYVLEGNSAHTLIEAREKAFWTAKAAGAHDVIDVVVPRAVMHEFFTRAQQSAQAAGAGVVGCGHAGDGNVHLAVFCADDEVRHQLLHDIFAAAMALGGAISGEHGLGRAKTQHFLELEDPVKIALMRRIKDAFDPAGILNPGVLL
ncbi:MAG: FAD-linked oxidase C-terminal domain-containing protein, partial [Mycolicibacter algericus]